MSSSRLRGRAVPARRHGSTGCFGWRLFALDRRRLRGGIVGIACGAMRFVIAS